ncbi:transposase, partial [Gordonia caeni]|uniref:Transposase n=1 Tax=Gordonia caeni TaxID=1007097 RepID=A0ABP7PVM2_9ACTN
MAKDYRPVDRDQVFLLPPDMREWVPESDPVWLVIAMVERLDTSSVHGLRRTGGVGRRGYDPDMLLTLLIWAWANGRRSSRTIERLCHRDLSFRIICAGDVPDHVTISRFRAQAAPVMAELFTQTLIACAELGMGRLGVVALDGTKISSDACPKGNRSEAGLAKARDQELARLRTELEDVAAQADTEHERNDAEEDDDDHVPPQALGSDRLRRIDEALAVARADNAAAAAQQPTQTRAQLDLARALKAREDAERADQQWLRDFDAGIKRSRKGRIGVRAVVAERRLQQVRRAHQDLIDKHVPGTSGIMPRPIDEATVVVRAQKRLDKAAAEVARHRQAVTARISELEQAVTAETSRARRKPHRANTDCRRNITDPQSRAIPKRGGGWIQGYNCQAVVTADGLIMATDVTNEPIDTPHLIPMMTAATAAAETINAHRPAPWATAPIGILLADAGYHSERNLTADGCDRLIPSTKSHKLQQSRDERVQAGLPLPPEPDRASEPIEHMSWRLQTDEGHALYSQRSHIAETPFGHAKHNLGFTRFTGRGLLRAKGEFAFHAIVHNIIKAIGTGHLTPT